MIFRRGFIFQIKRIFKNTSTIVLQNKIKAFTLQLKVLLYYMEKQIDDIKAIREMMEKSSKFLSLSGLAGIFAGSMAIAGAAFAYFYLLQNPAATDFNHWQELIILVADALIVLTLSIGFAIYFSWRKARKRNQKLFNKPTLKTIYNLALPLMAGGIFSIVCLVRGQAEIVASVTLIFYGLGLINASKYTFEEIHYLGILQVILGLLAAIFPCNGLLFWTLGFGLCHIIYGLILYKKYDLK